MGCSISGWDWATADTTARSLVSEFQFSEKGGKGSGSDEEEGEAVVTETGSYTIWSPNTADVRDADGNVIRTVNVTVATTENGNHLNYIVTAPDFGDNTLDYDPNVRNTDSGAAQLVVSMAALLSALAVLFQ